MIPDCSAFSRIILVVNKRLTIKSENSSAYCIVNSGGTWAEVFTIEADGIRIEGFTIAADMAYTFVQIITANDDCSIIPLEHI